MIEGELIFSVDDHDPLATNAEVVEPAHEVKPVTLSDPGSNSSSSSDPEELTAAVIHDAQLLSDIRNIPKRMAFKIGEVADICGVKQYVLRYWESEFDELHPKKSIHNQRMYLKRDIETVLIIKKLLYKDRFSINGARRSLRKMKAFVKQESEHLDHQEKNFSSLIVKVQVLIRKLDDLKSKLV